MMMASPFLLLLLPRLPKVFQHLKLQMDRPYYFYDGNLWLWNAREEFLISEAMRTSLYKYYIHPVFLGWIRLICIQRFIIIILKLMGLYLLRKFSNSLCYVEPWMILYLLMWATRCVFCLASKSWSKKVSIWFENVSLI